MAADPSIVFDTLTAFWRSCAVFAACDIGLFDALAEGPASAADVAGRVGASARGTAALLDSCVALGLAEKDGPNYRNTETAERFLTTASPSSLLGAARMQAGTYPMWGGLAKAVREGKPVVPPSDMLGGDPALTRRLAMGMHGRALGMAQCLIETLNESVDLGGRSLLADVGGGPGTFSIAFAGRYPSLRARVMDLAPVLEVAKELIRESGVADRVETVPCDVTCDELGSGFDAALVSGLLHRMDPAQCRSLLKKVFDGMEGGGSVVVCDLLSYSGAPPMAVLFGLQMLLTTDEGVTHRAEDVSRWLEDVGFVNLRTRPLPPPHPHTMVVAWKP